MSIVISVDGEAVKTISDDEINMMAYSYSNSIINQLFISNIVGVCNIKLLEARDILQKDWVPKIRQRYDTMPTQDEEIAALIYSQEDYKDYDDRNKV